MDATAVGQRGRERKRERAREREREGGREREREREGVPVALLCAVPRRFSSSVTCQSGLRIQNE